jgi:ribosomal protein S18 acetylase RimI-like enzyme
MNGTLTQVPTSTARLAAGTTARGRYCVRAAGPADDAAIRDFVCGLSVRTQYLRFFTAMCPPSRGLLKALTAGNPRADILLVTGEDGQVVGHGMAVDAAGERAGSADLGLVIADDWQGQGLGPVLLRLLEQRAAGRGITTVVLDVLPENRRMLGIVDRRWPGADRQRTPDSINITVPVTGTLPVPDPAWIRASHAA